MYPRVLALFVAALPLLAQARVPQVQPAFPGQVNNQPEEPQYLSVEFAGGSVEQYVQTLKASAGKVPVNLIVSERASKQQLSRISLKEVSISVAAGAIESAATTTSGMWFIQPVFVPGAVGRDRPQSMTLRVDYSTEARRDLPSQVEAFSLSRILRASPDAKASQASVLTAIETGLKLQLSDNETPPDLKFHPDSGLLFVKGSPSDIHLVSSVITKMSEESERAAGILDRRARSEKIRALAVREAKLRLELASIEYQNAERTETEFVKMNDRGAIPAAQLADIQLEKARARVRLQQAEIEVERAQIADLGETAPADIARPETQSPQPGSPTRPAGSSSTKRPGNQPAPPK